MIITISKKRLEELIKEEIEKLLPNKPTDISLNDPVLKQLEDSLVDMLQKSYTFMGGWKGLETPEGLKKKFTNFYIIDVDSDTQPEAAIYYTSRGGSNKASAIATDGSEDGKKAIRKLMKDFFTTKGNWIEVSGAAANVAIKKLGLDYVSSEDEIRQLLKSLPQEDIIFHGKHPYSEIDYGTGWYSRTIGNKRVTKIIVGNPP